MFEKRHDVVSVEGYMDVNYVGELDDEKSHACYVFRVVGGPICWRSTIQSLVAFSTTETNYVTITKATKEVLWLKGLVKELGVLQEGIM